MTAEEVRALKVGDIVWMLCLDEEPGTAVKCEVTKTVDEYGLVTIKCVGNPDCKGHRPWHGDISKSEVEVYEKAISRAESSIEDSEQSTKNYQEDIKQNKANIENLKEKLAKAREEEQRTAWVIINEEVVQIFAHDKTFSNCPKYATAEEAYEALAGYYKAQYEVALSKATKVMYFVSRLENIIMLRDCQPTSLIEGGIRGYDYNGYEQTLHSDYLFNSRQEAEAEWERRKK